MQSFDNLELHVYTPLLMPNLRLVLDTYLQLHRSLSIFHWNVQPGPPPLFTEQTIFRNRE